MTVEIIRLDGAEVYDLIYEDYLSMLPSISQETMQRAMTNSSHVWVGRVDGKIIAVYGLIPPTLLSDVAYLWLFTTKHFTSHTFLFIRHSQRIIGEMLKLYPHIVGHGMAGHSKSLRWLRWIGAEFSDPIGNFLPFEIKAKQWPQDLVQSA